MSRTKLSDGFKNEKSEVSSVIVYSIIHGGNENLRSSIQVLYVLCVLIGSKILNQLNLYCTLLRCRVQCSMYNVMCCPLRINIFLRICVNQVHAFGSNTAIQEFK